MVPGGSGDGDGGILTSKPYVVGGLGGGLYKGLKCSPKDLITYSVYDEAGNFVCGEFLYVTKVSGKVLTGLDLNRCHFGNYSKETSITLGEHCRVSRIHKSGVGIEEMLQVIDDEEKNVGRLMEFVNPSARSVEMVASVRAEEPEGRFSRLSGLVRKLKKRLT